GHAATVVALVGENFVDAVAKCAAVQLEAGGAGNPARNGKHERSRGDSDAYGGLAGVRLC
ncbi:MAG TPA: hypothetical protein VFU53_08900, partial [Burkholderiales bacterium]|nr:hypothetical protein [Burkholderiales bacterium]